MRAVNIVGFKNSGKTTLAVALAKALAQRGLTVAAAKFSGHGLDQPNTDTARLAEHCQAVIGLSDKTTAIFYQEKKFLADMLPLVTADVLVVEGGKNLGWLPRILLARDGEEARKLSPELALASAGPYTPAGLESVTDPGELADLVLAKGFVLPGLDCATCGRETCHEMSADIVAGSAEPDDCQAFSSGVSVDMDGKPLGLNPFVAQIVAGSIRGMLSQLKGYAPGRLTITLDG